MGCGDDGHRLDWAALEDEEASSSHAELHEVGQVIISRSSCCGRRSRVAPVESAGDAVPTRWRRDVQDDVCRRACYRKT